MNSPGGLPVVKQDLQEEKDHHTVQEYLFNSLTRSIEVWGRTRYPLVQFLYMFNFKQKINLDSTRSLEPNRRFFFFSLQEYCLNHLFTELEQRDKSFNKGYLERTLSLISHQQCSSFLWKTKKSVGAKIIIPESLAQIAYWIFSQPEKVQNLFWPI